MATLRSSNAATALQVARQDLFGQSYLSETPLYLRHLLSEGCNHDHDLKESRNG